jgi:hypothetical protein
VVLIQPHQMLCLLDRITRLSKIGDIYELGRISLQ